MDEHLDIPEFLRRQDQGKPSRIATSDPIAAMREYKTKRPANWHLLTKAEQNGTAEPATIELRKQMERDKKEKTAARIAQLRESHPTKPKTSSKITSGDATRFGVVTEKGVAFSFNANDSSHAREIFSAMRKRGEVKGLKVKSLRRIKPGDSGVDGGDVPHKEAL